MELLEVIKNNTLFVKDLTLEKLSKAQIWIDNPENSKKKILICIGSVWILTDFFISILQRVTNTREKNTLGPFTYLSVRYINNNNNNIQQYNNPIKQNATLIFGIPSNLQFQSSKGLARNMLGGYCIGIAFGMSSLSIFNSIYQCENKSSLSSIISCLSPFSLYTFNSCIFYTMEYLWAAIFHPKDVSFNSFMLYNHSNEFHIALCISTMEYLIEKLLFPNIKRMNKISLYGLGIVIIGQIIRTAAQFTAGINFTHQIAYYKKKNHELIKYGVYKYLRHPSYFGFFYWSIGTQLLLNNPMSTVIYTFASWSFFADRIPFSYSYKLSCFIFFYHLLLLYIINRYEEEQLIKFFGDDYRQYRKQTIIGIPFIG